MRILLVEDHEDTVRVMVKLLERSGHQVRSAATCAEALELASGEAFDLVISDLGLPDCSGLDLMRQLREARPVRGIALSGYAMAEDKEKCREAGFEEHLSKPINFDDLQAAIGRMANV